MKAPRILDSILMKEIVSIRIDSMWKMIFLAQQGRQPGPMEEGATGVFDNKGALFVPGGLVFNDSDRKPIQRNIQGLLSNEELRVKVREAMRQDNATLLFESDMVKGVNLDNGFFADVAATMLVHKQAAMKRSPSLETNPPVRVTSDHITRSHVPTYLDPPYGARTRLSSCLSVCLSEPRMYFVACRKEFGLRDEDEENSVWKNIRDSTRPITGKEGDVLAWPHVVVCHTTRYTQRNMVGMTRILGLGRFGEFATFTLERIQKGLLTEVALEGEVDPKYVIGDFHGTRMAAVLRIYSPTKPGKRRRKMNTFLIAIEEDLGLKSNDLFLAAMERYKLA